RKNPGEKMYTAHATRHVRIKLQASSCKLLPRSSTVVPAQVASACVAHALPARRLLGGVPVAASPTAPPRIAAAAPAWANTRDSPAHGAVPYLRAQPASDWVHPVVPAHQNTNAPHVHDWLGRAPRVPPHPPA